MPSRRDRLHRVVQPESKQKTLGKVFVVDDDPDVRGAISDVLELYGYDVASATNGQHALDQLNAGYHPDLILLDLNMPVMTGQQLLQRLATPRPPPWVVVVTATNAAPNLGAAVDQILVKPFELAAILAVAEKYCRRTRG